MVVMRRGRLVGLVAAATVIALVAGGCARSKPTPIIIVVTPRPSPTSIVTPVPTASPTPTASPVATPTHEPTLTPPPPARPVSAATCTGAANVKDFWAKASTAMSWDVYCPVLPAGWYASGSPAGGYGQPDDTIWMTYSGQNGAKLRVDEGAFCTNGAANCAPGTLVGPTTFGDILGTMDTLSDGSFAVYVRPGTARGYSFQATGMSRDTVVSIAAAFVKVAKS